MCISIIFGVNLTNECRDGFIRRLAELGQCYEYGLGIGQGSLLPGSAGEVMEVLKRPMIVFEVHDLPEPHCACDIDHEIRIGAKTGQRSRFFDFIREILGHKEVKSLAILFFQDDLPGGGNIRRQCGTFEDFTDRLNTWHTWQVEGFEPNREAYYIADFSPLLYTFTDSRPANQRGL